MTTTHRPPTRRTAWLVAGALVVAAIVARLAFFAPAPPRDGHAPHIVPSGRSDASHVLDPASFSDPQQQRAYTAARAIPAVLNQLYCWCHCRESTIFRHRSLLECFESDHGSQCGICMGEATLAHDMVKRGVTDVRQIQDAIDGQFGPQARGPS
jgi:uncharacterized protein with PCYCGC motif